MGAVSSRTSSYALCSLLLSLLVLASTSYGHFLPFATGARLRNTMADIPDLRPSRTVPVEMAGPVTPESPRRDWNPRRGKGRGKAGRRRKGGFRWRRKKQRRFQERISPPITFAAGVGSACPRDVSKAAHMCFTDYSSEYQNMQTSPSSLCCGVDVETLRAFCSSYMEAMRCIDRLKENCPGSTAPEQAMSNLHGAQSALKALCADDRIIEIYARHQQCLTDVGNDNMKCLKNHLNASDNVRLLANVDSKHVSEFCSDMRVTLRCVQNNVNRHCGKEAAKLAATLVKPMIRQSTKCDYSIVTKAPVYRQGQPSPSSRDQSQTGHEHPSGRSAVATWSSATLVFLLWLPCVIRTLLLPS